MLKQVVPANTATEWFIEIVINVWELIERLGTWKNGFRLKADENCTLLGYHAASSGNLLLKFRDNLPVPSSWGGLTDRLSRNVSKKLPLLAA